MNPFDNVIKSTRRDSALYSPDTINNLVSHLQQQQHEYHEIEQQKQEEETRARESTKVSGMSSGSDKDDDSESSSQETSSCSDDDSDRSDGGTGSGDDNGERDMDSEEDDFELDDFYDARSRMSSARSFNMVLLNEEEEEEVFELIGRLKELVGDFDERVILEKVSIIGGSKMEMGENGRASFEDNNESGCRGAAESEAKESPDADMESSPVGKEPPDNNRYATTVPQRPAAATDRLAMTLPAVNQLHQAANTARTATTSIDKDSSLLAHYQRQSHRPLPTIPLSGTPSSHRLRSQQQPQQQSTLCIAGHWNAHSTLPPPSPSLNRRYSLGTNRFSVNARKLSVDTLGYVNGDKLLRASTRFPFSAADTMRNLLHRGAAGTGSSSGSGAHFQSFSEDSQQQQQKEQSRFRFDRGISVNSNRSNYSGRSGISSFGGSPTSSSTVQHDPTSWPTSVSTVSTGAGSRIADGVLPVAAAVAPRCGGGGGGDVVSGRSPGRLLLKHQQRSAQDASVGTLYSDTTESGFLTAVASLDDHEDDGLKCDPHAATTGATMYEGSPYDDSSRQEHNAPAEAMAGIFAEFCIIGVLNSIIEGSKALDYSTLQPTEISSVYTAASGGLVSLHQEVNTAAMPIIGNLHEYCFPFGAQLKYVTRKELGLLRSSNSLSNSSKTTTTTTTTTNDNTNINSHDQHLSRAPYGMQYQLMQFTDATGATLYATCVISTEPVAAVSTGLQKQLQHYSDCVVAANTIKQYLGYYVYRKLRKQNQEINQAWSSNITRSRLNSGTSNGSGHGQGNRVSDASDMTSESRKSKSFMKAIKKALNFKSSKSTASVRRKRNKSTESVPCTAIVEDIESSEGGGGIRATLADASASNAGTAIAQSQTSPVRSISLTGESQQGEGGNEAARAAVLIPVVEGGESDRGMNGPSVGPSPTRKNRITGEDDAGDDVSTKQQQQQGTSTHHNKTAAGSSSSSSSSSSSVTFSSSPSNQKVAVVTQRAYCIISDKPLQPLFFQALEAIALRERERAFNMCSIVKPLSHRIQNRISSTYSTTTTTTVAAAAAAGAYVGPANATGLTADATKSNDGSSKIDTARSNGSRTQKLQAFLERVLFADYSEALKAVYDAQRELQSIHTLPATYSVDSSSRSRSNDKQTIAGGNTTYDGIIDLSTPDYLPSFTVKRQLLSLKEWTSAVALALLPAGVVVHCISLLLQEQSLLIYGRDAGLVTTVCTALAGLLFPLSWEGIFVPLLPTAAYEALDAPVPYLIGVVSDEKPTATIAPNAGLLALDDFVRYSATTGSHPAGDSDCDESPNKMSHRQRRMSRLILSSFTPAPAAADSSHHVADLSATLLRDKLLHQSQRKSLRHTNSRAFRRTVDAHHHKEAGGEDGADLRSCGVFFQPPAPSLLAVSDPLECPALRQLFRSLQHFAPKIRQSFKHPRSGQLLWNAVPASAAASTGATGGRTRREHSPQKLKKKHKKHSTHQFSYSSLSTIKVAMHDLSPESIRSLRGALHSVVSCISAMCGEVLTQPGGWRQFGAIGRRSQQFEFLPELFMHSLRTGLQLQESIIHTQMFVSFMDSQREAYESLAHFRTFIADWVYYRLKLRKCCRLQRK